jgi:hypothetical protein
MVVHLVIKGDFLKFMGLRDTVIGQVMQMDGCASNGGVGTSVAAIK